MSRIVNTVMAGALALVPMVGVASANDVGSAECSCASAASGVLTSVSGDVTLSGSEGFVVGQVGSSLTSGSQLHTGEAASAVISFGGNCNVTVGAHSKASIVALDNGSANLCAKVAKSEIFENDGDLTNTQAQAASGLGLLGGVGLGVAAIAVTVYALEEGVNDDDGEVSVFPAPAVSD